MWAAYNGVAELVDHRQPQRGERRAAPALVAGPAQPQDDRRLESAWFGDGYSAKVRAYRMACDWLRSRREQASPPDGFIARTIGLPAPMDVILGRLRGADGAIAIPLDVTMKEGELSGGQIAAAASGALASVLVTALASASLTVAEDVTKMVGVSQLLGQGGNLLGFGKQNAAEPGDVILQFAAGATALEPAEHRKLLELIERAARDTSTQLMVRHELSGIDVPVAAARANPGTDQALALAGQLRGRKRELLQSRAALASEAQVALAVGAAERAEPMRERLRGLERERAAAEQSLDRLYELVRPGAALQAGRRTRSACLEIAQQRVELVREALIAPLGDNGANRLRVANPRFEPDEQLPTGRIVITLIPRKRA